MSLRAQQEALWRAVRGEPLSDAELGLFAGDARLAAEERLALYHRMYYVRQINALAELFPRTRSSLPQARFNRLALEYIQAHPSEHPALEHVGCGLARFLHDRDEPACAQIAELEWLRTQTLLAPDPPVVAQPAEAATPELGQARLRFVPALRWVCTQRKTYAVFSGEGVATDHAHDDEITVVFFRRTHVVHHMALDPAEARALARATGGSNVAAILADYPPTSTGIESAFKMLSGWFSRHWIAAIQQPTDDKLEAPMQPMSVKAVHRPHAVFRSPGGALRIRAGSQVTPRPLGVPGNRRESSHAG